MKVSLFLVYAFYSFWGQFQDKHLWQIQRIIGILLLINQQVKKELIILLFLFQSYPQLKTKPIPIVRANNFLKNGGFYMLKFIQFFANYFLAYGLKKQIPGLVKMLPIRISQEANFYLQVLNGSPSFQLSTSIVQYIGYFKGLYGKVQTLYPFYINCLLNLFIFLIGLIKSTLISQKARISPKAIKYVLIIYYKIYKIITIFFQTQSSYRIQMTKMVRRFKFSDLKLAFRVRDNMFNALVQFDENYNQLFEVDEIKNAMMTILKEDQMEIQYVIKNVFRYDRDGDNAVTYAQFTNFSVQQHFGEMAIQRLHRKGYYINGAKRVMNVQQFETTLNYCLQFISSKGTRADYERLFKQVDLDKDGVISYQDYFIFLRQYFGSHSEAFEQQQKNPRPLPPRPTITKIVQPSIQAFKSGYGESQQKFAKLIYTQFKISVMDRDKNKNLVLESGEVEDILSNALKLSYNQINQIKQKCLSGNSANYQQFLRTALVMYMSQVGVQKFASQSLNENEFVQLINKLCHFVSIRPSEQLLKTIFKQAKGGSNLTIGEVKIMLKTTFESYKFDMRGLPSNRIMGKKIENISRYY